MHSCIVSMRVLNRYEKNELAAEEMLYIDGGRNAWYVVGGALMVVGGIGTAIAVPEIGAKAVGVTAAINGVSVIVDGLSK